MATSGSTVSHLRMWYSIHSLLMVMSPSKKWKRRSSRTSAMRSACMSIPYTSQSVAARMRLDRWWPMKPLTPRIRIRFMMAGFFSFLPCDFELEEAQDFTIPAGAEPFAAFTVGALAVFWRDPFFFPGTENLYCSPLIFGESAREGRRHRAHEVVDLGGALRPFDAAVLGPAAPEVAAFGQVVGFQLCFS